ncbi:MAG: S8 family serine peptidase [Chloroflexi bacterium]|nr:S8 family serine peptidase [Chloroflexota bacterium]
MARFLPLAVALSLALGLAHAVAAVGSPLPPPSTDADPLPPAVCAPPASSFRILSANPQPQRFVPGVVTVKLHPEAAGRVPELLQVPGVRAHCPLGNATTHLLTVPIGSEEATAAALRQLPLVASAEPDYVRRLSVLPNDPMIGAQWALSKINAPAAWDITTGSSEVIIAILDSGVDLGHPDLKDKLVDGHNFVQNTGLPADDNGHGTHVAGIAAAAANNQAGIAGVSWGARIMPLKVTDRFGATSDSVLASAIRHAADRGARIINMSLGGPENSAVLREAIEYAAGRGALLVAAAGNCYSGGEGCGGQRNPVMYPAAYDQVVAVGATTSTDQRASYSGTGDYLDLMAPGGDPKSAGDTDGRSWILSTYLRGISSNGYYALAGTSQAAPHVAGLGALVWSVAPRLTAVQVQGILERTAVDLGVPGKDPLFGAGRIDALAAVRAAQTSGVPTPTPTPSPTPSPTPTPPPAPSPSATPTPTTPPVTAVVPVATGGEVRLGNVTVTLPPDVVSGETQVTVQLALFTPVLPSPEGMVIGSTAFDLTLQGAGGTSITQLARPIRLSVRYTDSDLAAAGGVAENVVMGVLDPATGQWQRVPTTADGAARTVGAEVGHLTKFTVLAVIPRPRLTRPDDGALFVDLAPRLAWSNPPGATQYQIQVLPFNLDGPAINLIRNAETAFPVPAPVMGQGNYILLPGMTYTWRVRTTTLTTRLEEHAPGWSAWESRAFRTGPPTSATIRPVSPANGAQVSGLTPALTWDNLNPAIFYYEVQVSRDPTFETHPVRGTMPVYWNLVHGGETTPLNTYTVPAAFALEPATRYSWRVRPRVQGDGVPVAWSETWSFQTP